MSHVGELKKRYNYHPIFFPEAYRIAQSIIRSWKANKGKGKTSSEEKSYLDCIRLFSK
jgi:hypothetical protein